MSSDDSLVLSAYNLPASQHNGRYVPSALASLACHNPYGQHLASEKIIAFEKWDFSMAEVEVDIPQGDSNTSPPFSPFDIYNPPYSDSSESCAGLSRSASDKSKSSRRSGPSSPSSSPQLKKRQTSSGRPVHVSSVDIKHGLESKTASLPCGQTSTSSENLGKEDTALEPEIKPRAPVKNSHSLIERKYRENLNSRILLLGQTLASTRKPRNDSDSDNKTMPCKTRKADVLNDAVTYVQHAELESEAHIKEIELLKAKIAALEKIVGNLMSMSTRQHTGREMSLRGD